jgi:hypothetical protein
MSELYKTIKTVVFCVAAVAVAAYLSSCGLLASDTATKVTTTAVTAAKVAACSQNAIAEFTKVGDKSETGYLLLAAKIAECVREALGDDAATNQAAIAAGVAASLEVRRSELTAEQIRQAQDQPVKTEVEKVLKDGAK